MKLKQLLLSVCALLISLSAAAFELGKNNATIWHTKKSADQAKVLQQYLGKVFGKKYTLKRDFSTLFSFFKRLFLRCHFRAAAEVSASGSSSGITGTNAHCRKNERSFQLFCLFHLHFPKKKVIF